MQINKNGNRTAIGLMNLLANYFCLQEVSCIDISELSTAPLRDDKFSMEISHWTTDRIRCFVFVKTYFGEEPVQEKQEIFLQTSNKRKLQKRLEDLQKSLPNIRRVA